MFAQTWGEAYLTFLGGMMLDMNLPYHNTLSLELYSR
jgi:hypothetical protein